MSMFLFLGQKQRKLQILSDDLQFFDKFYAQLTPTNLLNLGICFDCKNDQPFSKHNAPNVKFRRFTCFTIEI